MDEQTTIQYVVNHKKTNTKCWLSARNVLPLLTFLLFFLFSSSLFYLSCLHFFIFLKLGLTGSTW